MRYSQSKYMQSSLIQTKTLLPFLLTRPPSPRDFEFTERMDYFCAFSVVVFSLLAFFMRLFDQRRSPILRAAASSACVIGEGLGETSVPI